MRAAALFAMFVIAACADREPSRDPSARGTVAPLTAGEERARIDFSGEPATTLRTGPNVPVQLPRGFTVYPGAGLVSNTVVERAGVTRTLIVMQTTEPVDAVMRFYRAQANAAGLDTLVDIGGNARASLSGTFPKGGEVAISARVESGMTRIELASLDAR